MLRSPAHYLAPQPEGPAPWPAQGRPAAPLLGLEPPGLERPTFLPRLCRAATTPGKFWKRDSAQVWAPLFQVEGFHRVAERPLLAGMPLGPPLLDSEFEPTSPLWAESAEVSVPLEPLPRVPPGSPDTPLHVTSKCVWLLVCSQLGPSTGASSSAGMRLRGAGSSHTRDVLWCPQGRPSPLLGRSLVQLHGHFQRHTDTIPFGSLGPAGLGASWPG